MDRMALLLARIRPAVWSKKKLKPKDFLGRDLVDEQRKKRRKRTED